MIGEGNGVRLIITEWSLSLADTLRSVIPRMLDGVKRYVKHT